ncbi:MAG: hypothetical protein ABH826_04855 [Patescibacteria group bacterium]
MQTFSKRHALVKEYCGYGEASLELRNRLLNLYGRPYSGNEHRFGAGNRNWIHERMFNKDLQMHFGREVPIESFRDETQTAYYEVFDFIELYYRRALEDLDQLKRVMLHDAICIAFTNSGSVYGFNEDGQVILKVDEATAKNIAEIHTILEPVDNARKIYQDCVDGLITRSKVPRDIVGDMYVVLEDFLINTTKQRGYDEAIRYVRDELGFHQTQIQIIEKLRAYRGDVYGPAHAGKGSEPKEVDALWYFESVIAQIKYVDSKNKAYLNLRL